MMDNCGFNLNPLTLISQSGLSVFGKMFSGHVYRKRYVCINQSVKISLIWAFFSWTSECSLKCLILLSTSFSWKALLFITSNFNNVLLSLYRWLPPLFVIFLSADYVKPINHSVYPLILLSSLFPFLGFPPASHF